MSYRADLTRITRTVVAPSAVEVDQHHRFPRPAIQAFGRAGILGMTVARGHNGGGQGLQEASRVVEEVARFCGGTATVLRSHFAAVAVLNRHGDQALKANIAKGRHLSTLALFTTKDHFTTPTGTAKQHGDVVTLHDRKTWVIAAGEADSYIWSSQPVRNTGSSTLWLVDGQTPDLLIPADHDGIGLRGNASTSICADPVRVPASCRLGEDGAGLDTVIHDALPWFMVLGASVALGLMEGAIAAARQHVTNQSDLARMRLRTDAVRVLHEDAVNAIGWEPERARRKTYQLTLAATEAAITVTDLAMKACGDDAFKRELGVERRFRDARAASAIEPTIDSTLELAARTMR